MKRITDFYDFLQKRLFSSTYQLQRVVILVSIALGLALVSFGSYYYYDRYYRPQPKSADVMLSEAEKAVREKPNDPEVRLNLGETYLLNQRFDDAAALASEVMKVYPNNQRAWFVLGIANALGGKSAEAIVPLQKFVDANKDSDMPGLNKSLQSAAYYLGDSYLLENQPDKAVAILELTVKWSKSDSDAMYKLGVAYLRTQRYKEAVNQFQSATVFVPNYTECYEGMEAAFTALQEPDYAEYARGMVAYSKKDYETALSLLLKAAQAKKDFTPIFDGLALTYEAKNDLKNAKVNYEIAAKLSPEDFTASTGLQRVNVLLNK